MIYKIRSIFMAKKETVMNHALALTISEFLTGSLKDERDSRQVGGDYEIYMREIHGKPYIFRFYMDIGYKNYVYFLKDPSERWVNIFANLLENEDLKAVGILGDDIHAYCAIPEFLYLYRVSRHNLDWFRAYHDKTNFAIACEAILKNKRANVPTVLQRFTDDGKYLYIVKELIDVTWVMDRPMVGVRVVPQWILKNNKELSDIMITTLSSCNC